MSRHAQAFVGALATEHFVLQAARSAIVSEQIGRTSIYMGRFPAP